VSANDSMVTAAALTVGEQPHMSLTFTHEGDSVLVRIKLPEGKEMDETNPLHVLAWYITKNFGELLVDAVNSWGETRRSMAPKVTPAAPRILGADAKPL